jgi:hypothetical protein
VDFLKAVALLLGVPLLLVGGFLAWYVYGAWPVPAGYSFPRHSLWGGGPTALFEGTLDVDDGCIRTAGLQEFTVVWPPGYSLAIVDGEPVVRAVGVEIRMGEQVRMGGGYYESGDPPPTTFNLGSCGPHYFLSTGVVES